MGTITESKESMLYKSVQENEFCARYTYPSNNTYLLENYPYTLRLPIVTSNKRMQQRHVNSKR